VQRRSLVLILHVNLPGSDGKLFKEKLEALLLRMAGGEVKDSNAALITCIPTNLENK
jgi:hypothetical protein